VVIVPAFFSLSPSPFFLIFSDIFRYFPTFSPVLEMQALLQWFLNLSPIWRDHFSTKGKPPERVPGGMIVVLNGFPGTGKHTILKKTLAVLPKNTRMIDNHLLIDPVQALYPDRSDQHHQLRAQLRAPVFQHIGKLAQQGCVVLMTACLAEGNERDASFFNEHVEMVRETGVPLFWINTHCDQHLLEQRVQSEERVKSTKTKLTDVQILRDIVTQHRLIQPTESYTNKFTNVVFKSLDASGSIEHSVDLVVEMIGLDKQAVETEN